MIATQNSEVSPQIVQQIEQTGEALRVKVREMWQAAKADGAMEPSAALFGRILHRPIEKMSKAFQEATEDDLLRLLHYAERGELIPPGADPVPYRQGALWIQPEKTQELPEAFEEPSPSSVDASESAPLPLCWHCLDTYALGKVNGLMVYFCAECNALKKQQEAVSYAQIVAEREAKKRRQNGHSQEGTHMTISDENMPESSLWEES